MSKLLIVYYQWESQVRCHFTFTFLQIRFEWSTEQHRVTIGENVATEFGITREQQDAFAARSYQRAFAAQKAGKFVSEIVPVHTKVIDAEGNETSVIVDSDDGIRDGVTAESLAKLKPVFSKTGSTHAGNASQLSDGAAAVFLCRRSYAKANGLPILGKYVAATYIGVEPKFMGVRFPFILFQAHSTDDAQTMTDWTLGCYSQSTQECWNLTRWSWSFRN